MTYFDGFIAPVPQANKNAYLEHARTVAPVLQQCGVRRMVEASADEVPHGKVTDFYRAVDAKDDETVVFSFFEYPDKAQRDSATDKFMKDPRLQDMSQVPFDAKRMIYGGFETIVDVGQSGGSYINGFIVPVPSDNKDAYIRMNERHASIFREYGALRFVQAWGDDVPEGKLTDFRRAVKAEPNETVVFAFIEWQSKQANDAAWDKIMKDQRMQPGDAPFDGKRMFWGGFEVILDTAGQTQSAAAAAPVTA